jgi:hypothetical protein
VVAHFVAAFRSILPAPYTHRAVKHYGGREQAIRRQEVILGRSR